MIAARVAVITLPLTAKPAIARVLLSLLSDKRKSVNVGRLLFYRLSTLDRDRNSPLSGKPFGSDWIQIKLKVVVCGVVPHLVPHLMIILSDWRLLTSPLDGLNGSHCLRSPPSTIASRVQLRWSTCAAVPLSHIPIINLNRAVSQFVPG